MLSDDVIHEIATRAMEDQFSRMRPATRHFFNHPSAQTTGGQPVTIHRWVVAQINDHDSREVVRYLAERAAKEVISTAASVTGELVFQASKLLPRLPLCSNGNSLFSEHNLFETTGDLRQDLVGAAAQLGHLDADFVFDERLQIFCPKPIERSLIRASSQTGIPCRVFGLPNYHHERSWVLVRANPACSLLVTKPGFSLMIEAPSLVIGAKFLVWVNNPNLAVRVIGSKK